MVRTAVAGLVRAVAGATAWLAEASKLTPTAASIRDRTGATVTRLVKASSRADPTIPRRAATTATTRRTVTRAA
jgi:hypothetical protein